jgi:hypothetical protein
MKRALLIAGGTVSGLGAVLAITPPQLSATKSTNALSGSLTQGSPSAATTTPAASQSTKSAAPSQPTATATKKSTVVKPHANSSATSAPASAATPTQTQTQTATTTGYSGTVTGDSFNARNYGVLSATVTFTDGKITNVSASQSPRSWSQNSLSALIPFVNSGKITVEQIKQYSSMQLPCATSNSCRSQASFTAEAFWSSVKSAISKANL